MTMMQLQSFFGWCAIINSGLFFFGVYISYDWSQFRLQDAQ